ncbi:MAG: sugar phosphate isomerase/epimerase [Elusimicrobia bacterium]|nr:sugar phosphate isomerase/epimerase [Elusimicrobiota bacterium]
MKLAVSNIAWGAEDLAGHLRLIRELGCAGVELAASLVWAEPAEATAAQRRELRSLIESGGLRTVGLHALTFTRPDLVLFGEAKPRAALGDYLKRMYELCRDLGGKTLVLGSPKSRRRGGLPIARADAIAADFFRSSAEHAQAFGVYLLIEPLSPAETDYICGSDEGAALVRRVGHPHFRLELDGRALAETKEDYSAFSRHKDILMHVQTSDPGLAEPGSAGLDHGPIGAALRASGYEGYVTLEMRRDPKDCEGAIRRGVAALQEHYVGRVRT